MQAAAEDLRPLPDNEGRDDLPEAALDRERRPQAGMERHRHPGRLARKVVEALDYPAEVLDAFENCLKGDGVDVEELDIVDKKEGQSRQAVLKIAAIIHAFRQKYASGS